MASGVWHPWEVLPTADEALLDVVVGCWSVAASPLHYPSSAFIVEIIHLVFNYVLPSQISELFNVYRSSLPD